MGWIREHTGSAQLGNKHHDAEWSTLENPIIVQRLLIGDCTFVRSAFYLGTTASLSRIVESHFRTNVESLVSTSLEVTVSMCGYLEKIVERRNLLGCLRSRQFNHAFANWLRLTSLGHFSVYPPQQLNSIQESREPTARPRLLIKSFS